eukprot:5903944-Pyramimonas_sp.AAC.1
MIHSNRSRSRSASRPVCASRRRVHHVAILCSSRPNMLYCEYARTRGFVRGAEFPPPPSEWWCRPL